MRGVWVPAFAGMGKPMTNPVTGGVEAGPWKPPCGLSDRQGYWNQHPPWRRGGGRPEPAPRSESFLAGKP